MKSLRAWCAALALTMTGCVYADVKVPLDTDMNVTKLGSKVGTASSHSILWLVAWGDEGLDAAAKDGGLTTINHTDQEVFMFLFGLYARHTVIAYGD